MSPSAETAMRDGYAATKCGATPPPKYISGFEAGIAFAWGQAKSQIDDQTTEIADLCGDCSRLTGENAVLRDLLRDCLPVLETVSDDDGEDWMISMSLTAHIKAALDGQDGRLFDGGKK